LLTSFIHRAVKSWCSRTGTPREEIFVTTKLWDADHGYESAFNALVDSLKKFGLDYFDLYPLHSPAECEQKRLDSWRALETAQKLGIVKSIGVSNFGAQHLESLLQHAKVVPCVNQIEVHPFGQRKDLVALCGKHNIKIEAYSPLARGNKLSDPRIGEIAERLSKTPAQVLINWSAARGNVVLPKSLTASRIQSNFDSFDFELSERDMAVIDSLEENYVTGSLHKSED
jgi:diketogulonate reductase-like aldo/keto reductase